MAISKKFNLTVNDFCNKYNLSYNALYVKNTRDKTKGSMRKNGNGIFMVNESYFVRRKAFQARILSENIEIYHTLYEKFSDTTISKMLELHTGIDYTFWRVWLGQGLWKTPPEGILTYRISKRHWLFNKYMRVKK